MYRISIKELDTAHAEGTTDAFCEDHGITYDQFVFAYKFLMGSEGINVDVLKELYKCEALRKYIKER